MLRSLPCPGRQLARGRSTPICLIHPVYKQIAGRRDPAASQKLRVSKYRRAVVSAAQKFKERTADNKLISVFLELLFRNSLQYLNYMSLFTAHKCSYCSNCDKKTMVPDHLGL